MPEKKQGDEQEEKPEQPSEAIADFIARVESLPEHNVHCGKENIAPAVIRLPVNVVYGVDDAGARHELVGTDGYLKVRTETGSIQSVSGTFTKSGGAGSGAVRIRAYTGDELKLLYGNVATGAVRATTTGDLEIDVITSTNATITRIGFDGDPLASEQWVLPSIGTALSGAGNIAYSGNITIIGGEALDITLGTMANNETFTYNFRFRSMLSEAPTIEATGGSVA